MTDHLPECPWADRGYAFPCICDRLRACEQRVRMEDDDYAYVAAQAEADGRWRGWVEALDAAREAVERVSSLLQPLGPALAAIDALRGSGNPYTPPSAEKGEKP